MNTKVFAQMAKVLPAVLFIVGVYSSCDKNEEVLQIPQVTNQEEIIGSQLSELRTWSDPYENEANYSVWQSSLDNLVHFCQKNAGPRSANYPNAEGELDATLASSSCALTSYMMAAKALSQQAGQVFELSGRQLKMLINQVGISGGNYKELAKIKNKIVQGKLNGSGFLTAELCSTMDRSDMKSFLQNSLARNRFVMVALKADVKGPMAYDKLNSLNYGDYRSPSASKNPDMALPYMDSQYILTTKNASGSYDRGHIVLLTTIDVWANGNGFVTYYDPLKKTIGDGTDYYEHGRLVLYSRFLDAMAVNGGNNRYTALAIGLK